MPLPRNPVIRAGALLRKSGAHVKSVSGQRQSGKQALRNEIDDWFEEADEDNDSAATSTAKGGKLPPSAPVLLPAFIA